MNKPLLLKKSRRLSMKLNELLKNDIEQVKDNLFIDKCISNSFNQNATNEAFSEKWNQWNVKEEEKKLFNFNSKWFLDLYGFYDEKSIADFLKDKHVVMDAGCGIGYKTSWLARLNPNALVIGMDFSESVYRASELYKNINNLIFIRGDIANTPFKKGTIDFINCDQVIHHTEDPQKTLNHFYNILSNQGIINLYVYAKKAIPRELIDDHFRDKCKNVSKDDLWTLSEQLTDLGRTLSNLNIKFNCPDIPLLNIKGGEVDIQRFIYWNFLKIFWNEDLGYENSVMINFDWYSPAIAFRYNEIEFRQMADSANLTFDFYHEEPACYTGRLRKK